MKKTLITSSFLKVYTACLLFVLLGAGNLFANGHGNTDNNQDFGEKIEPISNVIIHHVMDSHDWHITEIGETSIALHLPWILYDSEKGVQFYGSTHSLQETEDYIVVHDNVYSVKSKKPIYHGLADTPMAEEIEKEAGKYVIEHEEFEKEIGDETVKSKVITVWEKKEGVMLLDFSMTKTALHILIVAIVMLWLFLSIAKAYKKREGMAPRGVQSFFEPVILFVRDDVAKPYLHGKHDKFVPYLLTLFFFIWFANIFGLTPLSSNIAGNTTITLMLALLSLIMIVRSSTVDFWMHIFWFPGVPVWMKPLMLVVEVMGFITKPVALAIRLFANISAGHFMVLSLISLIFILGNNGKNVAGAVGIMPLSIAFSLFIFAVELIVAAVQAFVFSLLTAVFIGQAMETHSHDHDHAEEHHTEAHPA